MPIPWFEDPPEDLPRIRANLRGLLAEIARAAPQRRRPTVAMAQEWHRRVYEGVTLPVKYYAGEIRDSDPDYPELIDYEVLVGSYPGVAAKHVPAALEPFQRDLQRQVADLDQQVPVAESGKPWPGDRLALDAFLDLCSFTHGEWVRIHPFANGNGRIARLWVNWCALRYGLPPFLRLKPRPEAEEYGNAAGLSMRGDHEPMKAFLLDLLLEHSRP